MKNLTNKIGFLALLMLSSCGLMNGMTNEEYNITKEEMEDGCDIDVVPYYNSRIPEVFE